MLIRKAFKFRLKTTPDIEQKCSMMAGCCRLIWNKALALNLYRLESKQSILWYNEMAFWLKLWKSTDELSFLKDAHSQPLQQTLKSLDRAFKDAFDKKQKNKRIPVFKRKGQGNSFRFPQGFKLDEANSRIFLPKIGWVRYFNSRELVGTPKNITVSQSGKNWYISIQTEQEVDEPMHPSASIVGVDMGIARFATLSDGLVFEPVNSFRKRQQQLAHHQRSMSRKTKFSRNWKKAKAKVTKLHQKIGNIRRDYLHKTTTIISKNHAMVCLEDLQISNMSKSAAGSIEAPGRNVNAKSGLNKSILDQGWFEFRRQLEYKQVWRGGQVAAVNPRNTSRTCPCCGYVSAENRQSQAGFACVDCGFEENADLVGAINILAAGHAVLACGEVVQ